MKIVGFLELVLIWVCQLLWNKSDSSGTWGNAVVPRGGTQKNE